MVMDQPIYNLTITSGKGIKLIDKNGRSYLNFSESINIFGYKKKELISAVCKQSENLLHFTNMLVMNPPCQRLAETLTEIIFPEKKTKVIFTATGSEANEYVLSKMIEKGRIVGIMGSYHGLLTMTKKITLKKPDKNIILIKPNDEGLDTLESEIRNHSVSSIIIEPVMVHAGIVPLKESFLVRIQKIAKENNLKLIIDEVYTGFGKTGHMFSYEIYGIKPDIVTLGKSLGGGLPLGAVVGEITSLPETLHGSVTTSQGGNVLACSLGNTIIDLISKEKILEKVRQNSKQIMNMLEELEKHSIVREIRGIGYLWGIHLTNHNVALDISKKMLENGVLVTIMGEKDDVIRLAPPLTASLDDWERVIELLDHVFSNYSMS